MRIIGFNGSSRPFGNGYNLIKACLESFDRENNETELIQLTELQIQPCKSCYACKGEINKCILEDSMTTLYKKIIEADLLIMSTPIYMWQISAETKLFMERLYPFYHFNAPSDLKGKKLILLFTQASPDEKLFKEYFEYVEKSMAFLGFDVITSKVVPGLRNIGDYANCPEVLSELSSFGSYL